MMAFSKKSSMASVTPIEEVELKPSPITPSPIQVKSHSPVDPEFRSIRFYDEGINEEDSELRILTREWILIAFSFLPLPFFLLKIPLKEKLTVAKLWIPQTATVIIMLVGWVLAGRPIAFVVAAVLFTHSLTGMIYWHRAVFNAHQKQEKIFNSGFYQQVAEYKITQSRLLSQIKNSITYAKGSMIRTAMIISQKHEYYTRFNWSLLSDGHKRNFAHYWRKDSIDLRKIPKISHLDEKCLYNLFEKGINWKYGNNGLELLYVMCSIDKSNLVLNNLAPGTVYFICGVVLTVISQWVLSSVVQNNLFGIGLRLAQGWAFFAGGAYVSMLSIDNPIGHFAIYTNPEELIDVSKLFRPVESASFVINVFSEECLETYLRCFLALRATGKHLAAVVEGMLVIIAAYVIVFASVGLGALYLGHYQDPSFGYGFFNVLMILAILPNMIMLVFYLYYGARFNATPRDVIANLRRLNIIFREMQEMKKEPEMDRSQKMQFLFDCLEKGSDSLEVLRGQVAEMIETLEVEIESNSYKFLGILTCTTASISTIFIPIFTILWAAVVNFVFLVENITG